MLKNYWHLPYVGVALGLSALPNNHWSRGDVIINDMHGQPVQNNGEFEITYKWERR
jgi:hypothetical protein